VDAKYCPGVVQMGERLSKHLISSDRMDKILHHCTFNARGKGIIFYISIQKKRDGGI
jgi:hypothetical protein